MPQTPSTPSRVRSGWCIATAIAVMAGLAVWQFALPVQQPAVGGVEPPRRAEPAKHPAAVVRQPDGGQLALAPPAQVGPAVVIGRTRCVLSHRGIIASAILRPVTDVLVQAGDRVTKGQPLIKLYDLEPQAKVRARKQELKSIQAKAKFSRLNAELAEKQQNTGAVPFLTLNEIRATAASNDAQVLAAEAELVLATSELRLYTVTAPIDGEIAWLDVSPGTVTWPGAMIWGEIVDVSELDVYCSLPPHDAEPIAPGQTADVWLDDRHEVTASGRVISVGKSASGTGGGVPIIIRIANPQGRLRAELDVNVAFQTGKRK